PAMRDLLAEQARLEDQLAQLNARVGKDHPQVKQLTASLDAIRERVKKQAADWRDLQLKNAADPALAPGAGRAQADSEKVLKAQIASLQEQYAQLKRERDEQ